VLGISTIQVNPIVTCCQTASYSITYPLHTNDEILICAYATVSTSFPSDGPFRHSFYINKL
jgi:hypothetical protein